MTNLISADSALYKLFCQSTDLKQDCSKIIKCVPEIVKKISGKNPIIETVKNLLDRACPMLVDQTSFVALMLKIKNYFEGLVDDEDDDLTEFEINVKGKKVLKLVKVGIIFFAIHSFSDTILINLKSDKLVADKNFFISIFLLHTIYPFSFCLFCNSSLLYFIR